MNRALGGQASKFKRDAKNFSLFRMVWNSVVWRFSTGSQCDHLPGRGMSKRGHVWRFPVAMRRTIIAICKQLWAVFATPGAIPVRLSWLACCLFNALMYAPLRVETQSVS